MNRVFQGAVLLWCLNNESTSFVVLGYENACEVYTSKMELLAKVNLPFKPFVYAVVSGDGILVLGYENQIGLISVSEGTFTEMKAPLGTTVNKRLSTSHLLKVDDGFVFLVPSSGTRKRSFHYSPLTNKFKKVEIELPEFFSSVHAEEQRAYCHIDEQGNALFCSFETAYREKRFVPEMSLSKENISDFHDVFDLSCGVAYLSIEKKKIILVSCDKPDATAFVEHMRNTMLGKEDPSVDPFSLVKMPDSGKLVLIKDNEPKTEVKLAYRPFHERFNSSSSSVFFVSRIGHLEAYSTEDLTLLLSLPINLGRKTVFLPDGCMLYEGIDATYISDSSPFTIATKKLEEMKRKH